VIVIAVAILPVIGSFKYVFRKTVLLLARMALYWFANSWALVLATPS